MPSDNACPLRLPVHLFWRYPLLRAYDQPVPSHRPQRVVPISPAPAHAEHCFQSSALTALPLTPTHLFPATTCAHWPLMYCVA
jgi:hypothetical protein